MWKNCAWSGQTVGYHVGHEEPCKSEATRLMFVTAGMLRKYVTRALRHLHALRQKGCCEDDSGKIGSLDPVAYGSFRSLFPYDFVLIDEVHERSVDCDMAMLLIKCLAAKLTSGAAGQVRLPVFRIIVMSATISASDFATFFSGESLNMFEAEHAAWKDQTDLLRIKSDLHGVHLPLTNSMHTAELAECLEEAEAHQYRLRKRERLIGWAKGLSSSLHELARLWKNRRSQVMLEVLQEQLSSRGSSCTAQQWRRISNTAYVKGNCVEVARQTNFPVEEVFWEELKDLAAAPLTATAEQLADLANPTLLSYMGIEYAGDGLIPLSSSAVEMHPRGINEPSAAGGRDTFVAQGQEERFEWDDYDYHPDRQEYHLEKPKLNYLCLEAAARLLLLIHVQCLLRKAPQCGVLVFLPGAPSSLLFCPVAAAAVAAAAVLVAAATARLLISRFLIFFFHLLLVARFFPWLSVFHFREARDFKDGASFG